MSFHRILRKIFPFLYVRNWYTGQLELSDARAFAFLLAVIITALLAVLVWWLGQPIEYSNRG